MNRQLPDYGYTTGVCATAAAKGAIRMLRDQHRHDQVEILLPSGDTARFLLLGQCFTSGNASCFVVKDAGGDPDVTHGAEIHVTVTLQPSTERNVITIRGGLGIGRITKPGLALPVGEWAINQATRRMIKEAVTEAFPLTCPLLSLLRAPAVPQITISIPHGEQLAKKTLNDRIGIIGGLSILGGSDSGSPLASQAWTETIDAAIDIALACTGTTLVLSCDRNSEQVAQAETALAPEAYIMVGDHVGHALRSCADKGVHSAILAGRFAELLHIACGTEQLHGAASRPDLGMLAEWLSREQETAALTGDVLRAGTARRTLETTGHHPRLMSMVCHRVAAAAGRLAPAMTIKVLLAGYRGEVLYFR